MNHPLRKKKLFLFDLDGVFYRGKESREKIGGTKAIEALRKGRKQIFVLTNNSTDSVDTVFSRLVEFEIPFRKEEVLTSGRLTAEYIKENHGEVTYYLVGEAGLEAEMERCGHARTRGDKADFVVVGLDRSVTYDTLDHAARIVRDGAGLVATHVSALYMYKNGPAMAAGPLVKAIEYAGGKHATVIGKPSSLMFKIALRRANCDRADAVMIGDQLDTDIIGARRAGIDAVLVTSGIDQNANGYRVLAKLPNVDAIVPLL